MIKKEVGCCLDTNTGLTRCVLYIGAAGCFLGAILMFVVAYLLSSPHAVVTGIVALVLGVFMLATGMQEGKK